MSTKEKITFVEFEKPSLKAGKYTFTTKQEVKIDNTVLVAPESEGKNTIHFGVKGDLFRLNPLFVHSTFPPENGDGVYEDVLPHIILNKATLPWEYSADTISTKRDESDLPWLGLVVFNENQIAQNPGAEDNDTLIQEKMPTIAEAEEMGVGEDHLMEDEEKKKTCQTITVPRDLIEQFFPRKEELKWLTHVRKVSTVDKEDSINAKGVLEDGEKTATFSAIMANRLPDRNTTSVVYLVSLHGREDDLPKKTGTVSIKSGTTLEEPTHLTFVYLKKWTFYTQPALGRIHDYLATESKLIPATYKLPSENVTDPSLKRYLSDGFIPANHFTLKKDQMISWYRSPLIPFKSETENFDRDKTLYTSPDAATLYDKNVGMFNVTYAAAWKLGQLLTLRNSRISQKIYLSKSKLKENAKRNFDIEELQADSNLRQSPLDFNEQVIHKLNVAIENAAPQSLTSKSNKAFDQIENQFIGAKSNDLVGTNYTVRDNMIDSYHTLMINRTEELGKSIDFSNEEETKGFQEFENKIFRVFTDLRKELNPNVKEKYLKKYKAILKGNKGTDQLVLKDSEDRKEWHNEQDFLIQTTKEGLNGSVLSSKSSDPVITTDVDPDITQWFADLKLLKGVPLSYIIPSMDLVPFESLRFFYLDGDWMNALLDGANSIGDSTKLDSTLAQVQADTVRKSSTKRAFDARNEVPLNGFVKTNTEEPVSGILLHSQVVDDWPGLEIAGYANSSDDKLPLLRMEKLREGVIICLFSGELDSVAIQEPTEGVHYGFRNHVDNVHVIALKDPRGKRPNGQSAKEVNLSVTNSLLFRNWKKDGPRVINFDHLKGIIKTAVIVSYYNRGSGYNYNNAEFAVQMIRRMHRVNIQLKDK
ncbi:MAG: hypothetical protein COA38_19125 [Fluviicola sp.]|nr:MAG: hypothetical protein COA38_19125 [Fluviicola sp.]